MAAWTGCYSANWNKLLTPASFAHPAKVAPGLAQRIYQHLLQQGYVVPGQCVVDPFAGIGGFGFHALLNGLQWVGIELEEKFVALAEQNLTYWQQRYGLTGGVVLQGDSRDLAGVLGISQVAGMITSPPYAEGLSKEHLYVDDVKRKKDSQRNIMTEKGGIADPFYGTTAGQLGSISPGSAPACLLTSPPYAGRGEVLGTHNGIDFSKSKEGGKTKTPTREAAGLNYGSTPGNLGNLPAGMPLSALVSSPPYGDQQVGTGEAGRTGWRGYTDHGGGQQATPGQLAALPAGGPVRAVVSSPPYEGSLQGGEDNADRRKARLIKAGYGGRNRSFADGVVAGKQGGWTVSAVDGYGTSLDQLGNTTGETFWEAARLILEQSFALLAPGAVACFVTKDYLRNAKRVPFRAQWSALCEAVGFTLIEWHQASLITDHGTEYTLFGEAVPRTTKRSSFFRRLAEAKYAADDPRRIDHEDVLIFRKET